MGKLNPNTIVGLLNGKLGDLVFARMANGQVVVRHRPVREASFTSNELVTQAGFKAALAYVSRIRRDPILYTPYQAAAKARAARACDLANADFRLPPRVTDVDLSAYRGLPGDVILVEAVDDFEVVSVALTFTFLDGTLLEHGQALRGPGPNQWSYDAEVPMPPGDTVVIHATALDRPGNSARRTLHHAIQ